MRKKVFTGYLNNSNIDVFVTDTFNGKFDSSPREGALPCIEIGIAEEHIACAFELLLHETFEMLATQKGLRFGRSNVPIDYSAWQFFLTHQDLCEIDATQGPFILDVWPKIKKAHREFHKSRRVGQEV